MNAPIDLTGDQYGDLLVLELVERGSKTSRWKCQCKCGSVIIVRANNLRSKAKPQKSCRPCGTKRSNAAARKHGHRGAAPSTTYRSWQAMITRCEWEPSIGWSNYGGVGVSVCEKWRQSFQAFLDDMGERPAGKTLDRYPDKAGNYEPGNCRWATPTEQTKNRKCTRLYDFRGQKLTLREIIEQTKTPVYAHRIYGRINYLGWPVERAVFQPLRG